MHHAINMETRIYAYNRLYFTCWITKTKARAHFPAWSAHFPGNWHDRFYDLAASPGSADRRQR
jgi:hypothetical protein